MSKRWLIAALVPLLLAACSGSGPAPAQTGSTKSEPPKITNRIDVPPTVVQNLGITYTKVERRRVEQTLRVPGSFESPPEARREYHTMLPGRVEVLVKQYQVVEPGMPLFRLESPEWRRIQEALGSADAAVAVLRADKTVLEAERNAAKEKLQALPARVAAQAALQEAADEHLAKLNGARDNWQARVTQLEDLQAKGAGKATELADARGELQSVLVSLAEEKEKRAEFEDQRAALDTEKIEREQAVTVLDSRITAKELEIRTSEAAFDRALRSAAGALGLQVSKLRENEAWKTLDEITVSASSSGTVERIGASDGAWLDANAEVLTTLDLTKLRFRGRILQSDLDSLKEGLSVRVVPPQGGSLQRSEPATGLLHLPVEGDATERMLDVIADIDHLPSWARPTVRAEMEIITDATAEEELAIPVRSVVQDGLNMVVFVRDPADPNKVIRTTPALGPTDGRWIVIYEGVMEGSEVVLDGVYELNLTGTGKDLPKGGHFHADGTFEIHDS